MGKNTEHLRQLWRPPIRLKDPPGYRCLNHNEAPFSGAAELSVSLAGLNAYPEPYPLYERLAAHHGVAREQLLLTCGSEQGLRYVFDTYLDPGDRVVLPAPTFGMLEVFCHYRQAAAMHLRYDRRLRLAPEVFLDAIDASTRLVYLANPDSPTGAVLSLADIERIASRCAELGDTVLLLDEAYHDYHPLDTISLLSRFPSLILARSFSKGWGLAGIRAGYLVSSPQHIELLRKQKPMDELSSLSIELCLQVLDHPELVARNVAQVRKWKERFRDRRWATLSYVETAGNSILLRSTDFERHRSLFDEHWILPRTFKDDCLVDCIRFSVSTDEVMEEILSLLDAGEKEAFEADSC